MEALYNHSVSFDPQRCVGCTNCLRRCPTEAIRIREGQARIDASRCIDCGECIKVCTHKAKRRSATTLNSWMPTSGKSLFPPPLFTANSTI